MDDNKNIELIGNWIDALSEIEQTINLSNNEIS